MIDAVIDIVSDFLPLGAVARVHLTCKALRACTPEIVCAKLGLKKRLRVSLGAYMDAYPQRCVECGKYRRAAPRRRFRDTRVCLACARDRESYHYHPTKAEAFAIIRASNGGFLPRHRTIKAQMPPRMLTTQRQYLYRFLDAVALCRQIA